MRTSAGILVLVLAPGVTGCDSPSSVLPTAPVAPPPATGTVASGRWNLTTTLRSVTGPEVCSEAIGNLGTSLGWLPHGDAAEPLVIRRSGESVDLLYEHHEYVGTVVGDEFSATAVSFSGAIRCGEARFDYRLEGHVSGRFSGDGHALTAEEVYSYRLTSGETLSLFYDWSATRQ